MKKSIILRSVEQRYLMLSDFEEKAIGYHSGYRCEKCGHELILRSGEYGLFLGCERFPKCTGSVSLLTDEDIAEREYRRTYLDCQEDVAMPSRRYYYNDFGYKFYGMDNCNIIPCW